MKPAPTFFEELVAAGFSLRKLNDHDPIRATPNNESLCRGGFKTRPYTLTFRLKLAAKLTSKQKNVEPPPPAALESGC